MQLLAGPLFIKVLLLQEVFAAPEKGMVCLSQC